MHYLQILLPDEGDTVIITLTTENVNDETLVPYEISGVQIEDLFQI